METPESELVPQEHHHWRRKIEITLLAVALVVSVVASLLFVSELRWRWRRFKADWS